MTNEQTVVVTRHPALVEYLREIGVIASECDVISHATAEDVRGKHVIGVLPNHLACEAESLTEVPLALSPEQRGKELSLEEIRAAAAPAVTYNVRRWSIHLRQSA